MELHTEEGLVGVDDALVGAVVGVDKERLPPGAQNPPTVRGDRRNQALSPAVRSRSCDG